MSVNPRHFSPEELIPPATTVVSGAFLLSPVGIPLFVQGLPRVLLAGFGGFLAGKVADKVVDKFAENLGQVMLRRSEES